MPASIQPRALSATRARGCVLLSLAGTLALLTRAGAAPGASAAGAELEGAPGGTGTAVALRPDETPRGWALQDLVGRDPGLRLAAVVRLGIWGRPEDLARVKPLLDSADESLRLAAARALVRAGDQETLGRVAEQALADASPAHRFEALMVLREVSVLPEVGRRAAERALGDEDPALRLLGLDLLSSRPSLDSVPAISGALDDPNREVRLAAIALLGKAPDARALAPLLEHVDAADPVEHLAVIRALGGFRDVAPRLSAGPALLRQIHEIDEDVRIAAVDGLGRLSFAPAVPALRALAGRASGDRLALRATVALGRIGDPPAIRALVELLRRPAPSAEVTVGLRRAGSAAVEAIAAILTDAPSTSATAAAKLLGDIGDRRATASLVRLLQTRPTAAIGAAVALGRLRDPTSVPALVQAVTGPTHARSPGVREACLIALGAMADPRASTLVEATARDPDPRLRVAALDLAVAIGYRPEETILTARLSDPDPDVRRAAIAAVAAQHAASPGVSEALIGAVLGAVSKEQSDPGSRMSDAVLADTLEGAIGVGERERLMRTVERLSPASEAGLLLLRGLSRQAVGVPNLALPGALESDLLARLAGNGPGARIAAEVLSASATRESSWAAIVKRLERPQGLPVLDPPVRARLCPGLAKARSRATDLVLAELLEHDPDEAVRAAAAWAAGPRRRASQPIAAALERARRATSAPISANATAAVTLDAGAQPGGAGTGDPSSPGTGSGRPRGGWVRVRLVAPDGSPIAGQWIRVRSSEGSGAGSAGRRSGGAPVWARTDDAGEATLSDLPPPPHRVSLGLEPTDQAALTSAIASGRSPATTPLLP